MDFITWIMGFILWESMLESKKEEETDENTPLWEPIVCNIDVKIGQKTP